jgi:hypothetical protein
VNYKFFLINLTAIILTGYTSSGIAATHNSFEATQPINQPNHINAKTNTKTVKSTTINQSISNNSPFILGGTYDYMSHHPTNTPTCLNIRANSTTAKLVSPHALIEFGLESSILDVRGALGYETASGWGAFSNSPSYKYANTSQNDDYTINLNYIYQYAAKYVFNNGLIPQGYTALTQTAQNLITHNPEGFRQMCGDHFVVEINAGVSVLMKISLNFKSRIDKDVFAYTMQHTGGLNNIWDQIKNNPSGINYNLQISGIQVGGNPNSLNELFASYGGMVGADGYPILNCGSHGSLNEACPKLINYVVSYSSKVANQLTNIDDYYLYNPSHESWGQLGVFPEEVTPNPAVSKAMQDLTTQYETDMSRLNFLNHYHAMLQSAKLLSPVMNTDLSQLIANYQYVLNIYLDQQNKIMNCFNGFVSNQCIVIHDNILRQRADVLQNTKQNDLLTYLINSQYALGLITKPDSYTQTYCELSPVSDANLNLYMLNCNGQTNGSLDPTIGIFLQYDYVLDILRLHNLNYSYRISMSDTHPIYFSYNITQPLLPDVEFIGTWIDNNIGVLANGVNIGLNRLAITKIRPIN